VSIIKYLVVGSALPAAVTSMVYIKTVSNEQVKATARREGFSSKPIIPVKGDVPTIGYGTTIYPNGRRVKMTDPAISRGMAFEYLKQHITKDGRIFNTSIRNIPISQKEYDVYMDFTYQYGVGTWLKSSMLHNLKLRKYKKACASLLKYKYVAGYDCSTPGNNRCLGVWTEQIKRYDNCMSAQK
jgi:lysozyme